MLFELHELAMCTIYPGIKPKIVNPADGSEKL